MSDEQHPDEIPDTAFAGLDLDSLSDGVQASYDQWAAISATAAHRRRRRAWVLAAAALVVLVIGTATVLIDRGASDATIEVAVGAAADDLPLHLVPPSATHDITIVTQQNGATISYGSAESDFVLAQFRSIRPDDGSPFTAADLAEVASRAGAVPVLLPERGQIWVGCAEQSEGLDPDGTVVPTQSSATATWITDGVRFQLMRLPGGNLTCEEQVQNMAGRVADLVPVDAAGWRTFLAEHSARNIDEMNDPTGVTVPASAPSTTTLPEDPPTDRASAEEQIAAAVAGFSDQAVDGSFPNLEGGTTKAAEYREMFDLAGRQSGADQVEDADGDTSDLSRIRFVSPERASITIEFTSTLPTGTFTFGQEGEAILENGRWVVTYRTVINTLRRACVPPGGYDGC